MGQDCDTFTRMGCKYTRSALGTMGGSICPSITPCLDLSTPLYQDPVTKSLSTRLDQESVTKESITFATPSNHVQPPRVVNLCTTPLPSELPSSALTASIWGHLPPEQDHHPILIQHESSSSLAMSTYIHPQMRLALTQMSRPYKHPMFNNIIHRGKA